MRIINGHTGFVNEQKHTVVPTQKDEEQDHMNEFYCLHTYCATPSSMINPSEGGIHKWTVLSIINEKYYRGIKNNDIVSIRLHDGNKKVPIQQDQPESKRERGRSGRGGVCGSSA
jgi:hypothetical protein